MGWFPQLGNRVSDERKTEALNLLIGEGYDLTESALVISVVCREIEHDNPELAFKYMRSFVGSAETLVIRTLATLCETEEYLVAEKVEAIKDHFRKKESG